LVVEVVLVGFDIVIWDLWWLTCSGERFEEEEQEPRKAIDALCPGRCRIVQTWKACVKVSCENESAQCLYAHLDLALTVDKGSKRSCTTSTSGFLCLFSPTLRQQHHAGKLIGDKED